MFIYGGGPSPVYGHKQLEHLKGEMLKYSYHVAGEEYLFVSLDAHGGYAHHLVIPDHGRLLVFDPELVEIGDTVTV